MPNEGEEERRKAWDLASEVRHFEYSIELLTCNFRELEFINARKRLPDSLIGRITALAARADA
jgi:hypothetical protein